MQEIKIPEIYFDHFNIRILRYIRRHPDNTERQILKRFGAKAEGLTLIQMCLAGYLVACKPDGSYTNFRDGDFQSSGDYRYWVSSKGRRVLDDRFDRLWQWSIPTIIATLALIVSVFSAIF